MLEPIIMGAIQGIAEWLPISSDGMIFLVKTNFFNDGSGLADIAKYALFLHFGTFMAALIYFRKDVGILLKSLVNYQKAEPETKKILQFIAIATVVSGALGFLFLKIFETVEVDIENISRIITLVIGCLLAITAGFQIKVKNSGARKAVDIKTGDSLILGIVQGLAVLPGLSRSGLTVATLLFKNFDKELSLRLSFLLSLPIVLGANIVLNFREFNPLTMGVDDLAALVSSFVFGIATIGVFLKLAKKVNFGYFLLIFSGLMILAALIG